MIPDFNDDENRFAGTITAVINYTNYIGYSRSNIGG